MQSLESETGLTVDGAYRAAGEAVDAEVVSTDAAEGTTRRVDLAVRQSPGAITAVIVYRRPLADLRAELGAARLNMLVNSAHTDNGSAGLVRLDADGPDAGAPDPVSHWWTLLGDPAAGRFLLVAFLPPVQHRTFLRVRDGHLECGCLVQRGLTAGDTFRSDELLLRPGSSPHDLLEEFGDLCAKRTPGRTRHKRPIAWNSWDYYFGSFEEDDLKENLEALDRFEDSTGLRVGPVVIDRGWFTDFGDWRANGRFSNGRRRTARLIRNAGRAAGIWVAPFIVHYQTRAALRSPQMCATGPDGTRVLENGGLAPTYFLDPTHPEGERFLRGLFISLRKAGYEYFKIDLIHSLVTSGLERRYHEDTRGRIDIVRRGMEIIRASIGRDAYLLSCGCPPEAVIGIVDANRIGGDISTYTSTVKVLTPMLAARYWMNGRLFTADPDCLVVRCDATASDTRHNPVHPSNLADRAGSRAGLPWGSLNEPRLWATLVGMSGGAITLADHTARLNAAGAELLATTVEHADAAAARPLDLMERRHPRLWLRTGARPALAVVNWDADTQRIDLPTDTWPELARFVGTISVWGNAALEERDGQLSVRLDGTDAAWFVGGRP